MKFSCVFDGATVHVNARITFLESILSLQLTVVLMVIYTLFSTLCCQITEQYL